MVTTPGKTYQVTFALSGNFFDGTTKELRVSAGADTRDFSIDKVDGWNRNNLLWEDRSMTFVASENTTLLQFESLSSGGTAGAVVGDVQVVEVPDAIAAILATDDALVYDASTAKFYLPVHVGESWSGAHAGARATTLNGVAGQLVTIGSAYENSLVQTIPESCIAHVWIGASDQTTEGDWHWQSGDGDGALFWSGRSSGTAPNGAYTNWKTGEPNDYFLGEDHIAFSRFDGLWNDQAAYVPLYYIVEWDADIVLSNDRFTLLSNPAGAFAIDSNTGELRIVDSALLDFEAGSSYELTVRVTDAAGRSYEEVVLVALGEEPAPVLANIESDALVFTENSVATVISNTIAVRAESVDPVLSATIEIAGGYIEGEDLLSFSDYGPFVSSWDNSNGRLTITGTDSVASWQTALRNVSYVNSSDNPVDDSRTISIVVERLSDTSNVVTRDLTVVAVNDAPTTADATLVVTEDIPHTMRVTHFEFLDVVEGHQFNAIRIVSVPVHGELLLDGAVVTDNELVSVDDIAAGKLVFTPAANTSGPAHDNLVFRVQLHLHNCGCRWRCI